MPLNFLGRGKITKVANKLTTKNVDAIKYMLKDDIGEGLLENAKDGVSLMHILEENAIFTLDRLDNLVEILKLIERHDVIPILTGEQVPEKKMVNAPVKEVQTTDPIPNEVIDFVANRLAGDWKRNARFLGVKDHELEQLETDNRKTFERSQNSLKLWMKNSKKEVSWDLLKTLSLTKLPRYDIIRDTEKAFPYLREAPKPDIAQSSDSFTENKYSNPVLTPTTLLTENDINFPQSNDNVMTRFLQDGMEEKENVAGIASNVDYRLGTNITENDLANATAAMAISEK